MKISVIGSGYAGLVTAIGLAELGHHVVCMDTNKEKIYALLRNQMPFYEPQATALLVQNRQAQRLHFTYNMQEAVHHGTVQFIAVGTPSCENGAADMQYVLSAARSIGSLMTQQLIIVNKSTVPIGTAECVKAVIQEELDKRTCAIPFSVVSNPEFLREGTAVHDFFFPDRVVIGCEEERTGNTMRRVYQGLENNTTFLLMDIRSAEFTKYAANAMLATRISFMNELSRLAEQLDVDIESVRQGVGSDARIGRHFLNSGCGYGGSCFPKDVQALIRIGQENLLPLRILPAVHQVNEEQKLFLFKKIMVHFDSSLIGIRVAVWGLSFKPNTDDMREAPSQTMIRTLVAHGAHICAYDPVAMQVAQRHFQHLPQVTFAPTALEALHQVDALLLITEWAEFADVELTTMYRYMKSAVIFDGRNVFDPYEAVCLGFQYYGIGRKNRNKGNDPDI